MRCSLCCIVFIELIHRTLSLQFVELDIDNKVVHGADEPLSSSEISVLSTLERFSVGSFGYETFVNNTCVDEYVYVYGYSLGECSSTSASTSLRYDWCGLGNNNIIYFNMVRFNNINCAGTPSWNFTYHVSQDCDTANGRKPICIADVEGWKSYGLKQHST